MKRFVYEGGVGTVVEEGGFGASDIILIDDRSDAIEDSWWEGKSLYEIIDELGKDQIDDDGDTVIPKVKLTIEVGE